MNTMSRAVVRRFESVTQVNTKCKTPDHDKVTLRNFKFECVLGTGGSGTVYLVRKLGGTDHCKLYAMKVLLKRNAVTNIARARSMTRERQILEAIMHSPFLIQMHYAFQTSSKLFLILDYASGGGLYSLLNRFGGFHEAKVRVYIAEIVLAVEHLHKLGIIYRDLKLENILLDRQGHVLLADFDLSKMFKEEGDDNRAHTYCGTPECMAPEVRTNTNGYDLAVDWWSLGVLTFELLTTITPFIGHNHPCVLLHKVSDSAKNFIRKMLEKNPEKRLGGNLKNATEIKHHPFFHGLDWEKLRNKRIRAPFKPALTGKYDTENLNNDFTRQPAIDPPAAVPANSQNLFRGYTYVAPQHLSEKPPDVTTFYTQYCNTPIFEPPEIDFNVFSLETKFNEGSFGTLFKATHISSQTACVAKLVLPESYRPAEVDALMSCGDGHKTIINYIAVHKNGPDILIFTNRTTGGDLCDYIVSKNGLPEPYCFYVFKQILDAVQYIHSKGFIHGDLKPENVVFRDENRLSIQVVDFGSASYNSSQSNWKDVPRYTLDYAPPEAVECAEYAIYSRAYDVWSLGATLYAMLMGHPPFRISRCNRASEAAIRAAIIDQPFFTANPNWRTSSVEYRALVTSCLVKETSQRPKIDNIIEHPWCKLMMTKMRHDQLVVLESLGCIPPLEQLSNQDTSQSDADGSVPKKRRIGHRQPIPRPQPRMQPDRVSVSRQ